MKDFQKELNVFQEALHIEKPWYVSSHLLNREHEILQNFYPEN
ncbi:hypothetical protein [Aeribacillus alveayuensis]|uniref:Uncharacterized protein n=1 Tax=Aeribacillus alveayuensis TaxID=279215 RepID=A0ABT9VQM2_9BACI|nr:hypothetical protein [Bacillus alveayuensis]